MSNNRQPDALDWFALILLAIVWGASFLFIKRSVQVFEPMQMAMWRMVLSSALYLPIALLYWKKIDWSLWRPLLIVAFTGSAIPNFLFAVAQRHVDSSLAGVLNSLTPLFTMILGVLFFHMRLNTWRVAGIIMGLIGALILVLFNSHSGKESNAFYASLCVLATVCYAINSNTVKGKLQEMHPAALASAAFMLTGPLFLFGLWQSDGWAVAQTAAGWTGLGYVFYLAALGTVGGSILYFWLLQRTNALFGTSVTYLLPVMAMIVGAFDGEQIGLMDMLGTVVILTGLYLARK
jgi:drug/metabolite transporter (DMT)-like permease